MEGQTGMSLSASMAKAGPASTGKLSALASQVSLNTQQFCTSAF